MKNDDAIRYKRIPLNHGSGTLPAARMQAKVTTLASGHMPLLSHPSDVARIISRAAERV